MSIERSVQNRPVIREFSVEDERRQEIASGLVTGVLAFGVLTLSGIIAYAGHLDIAAVAAIPAIAPAASSIFSFSEARRLKKKNAK